jgi:RNA polymerase sigma factor (sigma-70 family)
MTDWKTLVPRARDGDLNAFGSLVKYFQDMAVGYAYHILGDFHHAQDAAQEAFLQAYRDLASLREPHAFPAWLRRLVHKYCDRITRKKQIPSLDPEEASAIASRDRSPARAAEDRELHEKVLEAVRSLPENEREVTTLYYINGYSQVEVGEFLEVPASTVKSRLHSARTRLRERMVAMVDETLKSQKPGPEFTRDLFSGIYLNKWWIKPDAANYEIDDGEIVVHPPDGEGPALHAEVGGMSWNHYRAGVDVLFEGEATTGNQPRNVQLCPNGTQVYCYLSPEEGNINYLNTETGEHVHLVKWSPRISPGTWHRFEILVEDPKITTCIDGKKTATARIPRSTWGHLGLLVYCASDTRVRLRNMTITFLKPTAEQVRELETDALTNWEDFKRQVSERGHLERIEGDDAEKVRMVEHDGDWARLLALEAELQPLSPECVTIRHQIASMEACHAQYMENIRSVLDMIGSMKPGQIFDCGMASSERKKEAETYRIALETWCETESLPQSPDAATREVFETLEERTEETLRLVRHLIGILMDDKYRVYPDEDEDFETTDSRIQHLEICNYDWKQNLRIVLEEIAAGRRLYDWHTPDGFNACGDCPDRVSELEDMVNSLAAWVEGDKEKAGEWGKILGKRTPEKRWLVASLCKHIAEQHKQQDPGGSIPVPKG